MRHLTLAILIPAGPVLYVRRLGATLQKPSDATTLIFLPQEQEIELVLSGGPEHLRSDATMVYAGYSGGARTAYIAPHIFFSSRPPSFAPTSLLQSTIQTPSSR
jgi:hypothetical protein